MFVFMFVCAYACARMRAHEFTNEKKQHFAGFYHLIYYIWGLYVCALAIFSTCFFILLISIPFVFVVFFSIITFDFYVPFCQVSSVSLILCAQQMGPLRTRIETLLSNQIHLVHIKLIRIIVSAVWPFPLHSHTYVVWLRIEIWWFHMAIAEMWYILNFIWLSSICLLTSHLDSPSSSILSLPPPLSIFSDMSYSRKHQTSWHFMANINHKNRFQQASFSPLTTTTTMTTMKLYISLT